VIFLIFIKENNICLLSPEPYYNKIIKIESKKEVNKMSKNLDAIKTIVASLDQGEADLTEKAYGPNATAQRKKYQDLKKLCQEERKRISDEAKKAMKVMKATKAKK
jgi:hypothetical protein